MNKQQRELRARQALELHLGGATYQQIADALGFASKSSAHGAVREALAARPSVDESDPVAVEVARLDAMLAGLWPKARKGDVAAIDRVLKISERRLAVTALGRPVEEAPADPLDELKARRDGKRAG